MLHLYIHPENPQNRLIQQAVQSLQQDGLIIAPSQAGYVFLGKASSKSALERLIKLRKLDERHQFTLLCKDWSHLGQFVMMENSVFRQLKGRELEGIKLLCLATKDVPKRLIHSKQKTIGIRLATNTILQHILEQFDEPLFISSVIPVGQDEVLGDPEDISVQYEKHVDVFLDSGYESTVSCSILDCTQHTVEILHYGMGDVSAFE